LRSFIKNLVLVLKTCLLLLWFVTLNFKNFTKLVWLDLNQICKRYERNKKTEKEKKKRNGKIEKGQGQRIGPVPETSPRPRKLPRTGTMLSSLPR
jgi:hypothetical protein